MRIIEEDFPITISPNLLPANPTKVLFFDIETTGFSGQSSLLYLIGCIFFQNGIWRIRQWFLDTIQSEKEMLLSFFDFITPYSWVIHFNGDTFDIPFIEKRFLHYHLENNFSSFQSLDLYKKIKPCKKPLGLTGMKQKDLEEFLGIHRKDPFTGGELIEIYYQYLETQNKKLLGCLLLHNADDLRGMLSILPLYGLVLMLHGNFQIQTMTQQQNSLQISLQSNMPLPTSTKLFYNLCTLTIKDPFIIVSIPIYTETMKYFYTNPKDYYYLPKEDQAIHKSVASYVDKAYRMPATLSNCYTKRASSYLPIPKKAFPSPIFQRDYKDKTYFIELTKDFCHNKELIKNYLLQIFSS